MSKLDELRAEFTNLAMARQQYPRELDPAGYDDLVARQEKLIVQINDLRRS